jgi:predicted transcriptional regulator
VIRKQAQFEQAKELRRRGFTYAEIAKMTGVAKSSISNWLSKESWSEKIRNDNQEKAARENKKRISLLNKARGNQHKKLYAEAERSASTEFKHYLANPLFVAGLMLYVGHGDMVHPNLIRLSTSKMDIHKVFIGFLKEFLGVPREKIRFWLLLYPSMDPQGATKAWSTELKILRTQFHKYQVIQGKSTKTALRYGIGNTIIGSTVLKKKLMKWTELTLKKLK